LYGEKVASFLTQTRFAVSHVLHEFISSRRNATRFEVCVIRFNCPNCDRLYELPAALAKITLVCKQCGKPFAVPERSTASPPAPLPPKVVAPSFAPVATSKPTLAEPKPPSLSPKEEPSEEDVLVTRPNSGPDIDFDIGGPTAQSLSEANRPRVDDESEINLDLLPKASPPPPPPWRPPKAPQAPEPEPTDETPAAGALPFLADLLVLILLVAVGIFLGQFLVNKPIGELLATPKFPSVDLLLLIAPAIVFVLIYLLLNKREKTLGAWLRRRRQQAS
jgi:hypothetical protein